MATKNESAEKCKAQIYAGRGMHYYSCGRAAKFEHDGAHYCKTHHPPNVKSKRIAKHAKLISAIEQECQAYKSADDELAAMRKNAELYRWLESQCASGVLTVASVHEFGLDPWSGDDLTGKIAAEMAKRSA